jgi:hypothetical protein
MKTAAIIFLGTGRYFDLFERYAESVFKFLLPEYKKIIFCFTDLEHTQKDDIIKYVKINHLQPPLVTLKRFETMLLVEQELRQFDYVFYIDADMVVVDYVTETEFENYKFFGVQHPGFIGKIGTFETRNVSKACVTPFDDLSLYYQGCLWGGKSENVISLCHTLSENVNDDLSRGVIAVWQDESHLNRYFIDNKKDVYVFTSSYAYPEKWNLNMEKKIIHLDKSSHPSFVGIV